MNRPAVRRAHATAGGLALLTVLTFWVSTVGVEVAGSPESIVTVKRTIPWGLLLLVPALAATGINGVRLVRNARAPLVRRKVVRTRIAAALGALVLVPCVLYLGRITSPDDLDATFYTVQGVELLAGAANIMLLALNFRDGLRLTGRLRRRAGHAAPHTALVDRGGGSI